MIEENHFSVIKRLMEFRRSSGHPVLPGESRSRITHVQELPMDIPGKTFLIFFQGLFHFAMFVSIFIFMILSLARGF